MSTEPGTVQLGKFMLRQDPHNVGRIWALSLSG
jgi:hypothetical protein